MTACPADDPAGRRKSHYDLIAICRRQKRQPGKKPLLPVFAKAGKSRK
jgi:hypothetical protein